MAPLLVKTLLGPIIWMASDESPTVIVPLLVTVLLLTETPLEKLPATMAPLLVTMLFQPRLISVAPRLLVMMDAPGTTVTVTPVSAAVPNAGELSLAVPRLPDCWHTAQ